MNRVRLHHVTEFEYDGPVSESYNEVHLQPQDDEAQHCIGFRLRTTPATAPSASRDYFGNWVHRFNIVQKHRRLRVEAESTVMVQEPSPMLEQGVPLAAVDRQREALLDAHYDFLVPSTYVPTPAGIAPLLRAVEQASGGGAVGFVHAATALVHDGFRYEKGSTHVHSSVLDVLEAGAGVCQDFSHLLIALARSRGLPARYVSGYLAPRKPTDAVASLEQVIGGQASHAWWRFSSPTSVGWAWTRRSACRHRTATSAWRTVAIMATSLPSAGSIAARLASGSRWTSASVPLSTTTGASACARPSSARSPSHRPKPSRSSSSSSSAVPSAPSPH